MSNFKSKRVKLGKGEMQIITIKFNDSLATHQQDTSKDDFEEPSELDEF